MKKKGGNMKKISFKPGVILENTSFVSKTSEQDCFSNLSLLIVKQGWFTKKIRIFDRDTGNEVKEMKLRDRDTKWINVDMDSLTSDTLIPWIAISKTFYFKEAIV